MWLLKRLPSSKCHYVRFNPLFPNGRKKNSTLHWNRNNLFRFLCRIVNLSFVGLFAGFCAAPYFCDVPFFRGISTEPIIHGYMTCSVIAIKMTMVQIMEIITTSRPLKKKNWIKKSAFWTFSRKFLRTWNPSWPSQAPNAQSAIHPNARAGCNPKRAGMIPAE